MIPKPLKNHWVQWSVIKKVVNGDGQRGAKPSKNHWCQWFSREKTIVSNCSQKWPLFTFSEELKTGPLIFYKFQKVEVNIDKLVKVKVNSKKPLDVLKFEKIEVTMYKLKKVKVNNKKTSLLMFCKFEKCLLMFWKFETVIVNIDRLKKV